MPESFTEFIEHVSSNVYMMECWKNQMGSLEKAGEMSDDDYLVENNLIGNCEKLGVNEYGKCGNCCVTQYVNSTLQNLRDVSNFYHYFLNFYFGQVFKLFF